MEIICEGQAGHASILHENTAAEKLQYMINKFMEFRNGEMQKLKDNPELQMGDVTAVNLTMLSGGLQSNIVPAELRVTFDIRVAIDVDLDKFEKLARVIFPFCLSKIKLKCLHLLKQMQQWGTEAGGGVTVKNQFRDPKVPPTKTDNSNPFWVAFQNAVKKL